jgi:hypothetical protein
MVRPQALAALVKESLGLSRLVQVQALDFIQQTPAATEAVAAAAANGAGAVAPADQPSQDLKAAVAETLSPTTNTPMVLVVAVAAVLRFSPLTPRLQP